MRSSVKLILAFALAALLVVSRMAWPGTAGAVSCGPCPATATDDINLRAGPSLTDAVLRVIPAGAELEWDPFRDQLNGFVPVAYDGTDGWAHRDYLLLWPGFATTTVWLNLRAGPGLDADVVAVMPPATEVMVLGGPENGFFAVRYEQTGGWAAADYLELTGQSA